jgi:Ca-activated chloride channel family protein
MPTIALVVALLGAAEQIAGNPFISTRQEPLVSLARPADTTSYAEIAASLAEGKLPQPAAVRMEELFEHFTYADPPAWGSHPQRGR